MNHGFTLGQFVRSIGPGTYALAQADSIVNAEVFGMVAQVIDVNQFVIALNGSSSQANQTVFSGLTPGAVYFLSPDIPGGMTDIEPTIPGQISKPVLIATATGGGIVLQMRGTVIPNPQSKPWNSPWGNIAEFYSETIDTSTTASADIPGAQVTFIAEEGRSYVVSWGCLMSSAANDRVSVLVQSLSLSRQVASVQRFAQATPQSMERAQLLRCPTSVLQIEENILQLRVWRLAGTGTTRITSGVGDPGFLTVADVGPTPS
jgi:hypothetical protein